MLVLQGPQNPYLQCPNIESLFSILATNGLNLCRCSSILQTIRNSPLSSSTRNRRNTSNRPTTANSTTSPSPATAAGSSTGFCYRRTRSRGGSYSNTSIYSAGTTVCSRDGSIIVKLFPRSRHNCKAINQQTSWVMIQCLSFYLYTPRHSWALAISFSPNFAYTTCIYNSSLFLRSTISIWSPPSIFLNNKIQYIY